MIEAALPIQAMTKNQKLVYDALARSKAPLSAYDILDQVREHGLRSPLQIYRALGPLMDNGHVHRLESLSAFVACAHPHHSDHLPTAFAICDNCGRVQEFAEKSLSSRLQGWAKTNGFKVAKTTMELRGTCSDCLSA